MSDAVGETILRRKGEEKRKEPTSQPTHTRKETPEATFHPRSCPFCCAPTSPQETLNFISSDLTRTSFVLHLCPHPSSSSSSSSSRRLIHPSQIYAKQSSHLIPVFTTWVYVSHHSLAAPAQRSPITTASAPDHIDQPRPARFIQVPRIRRSLKSPTVNPLLSTRTFKSPISVANENSRPEDYACSLRFLGVPSRHRACIISMASSRLNMFFLSRPTSKVEPASDSESTPRSHIAFESLEPMMPTIGAFPETVSLRAPSRPVSHISNDDITSCDENLPLSPTLGRPSYKRNRSSRTRPKTVLQFAHPPPRTQHKQRLHLRPKRLLQLHQITDLSRPVPVLDVLPSHKIASKTANRFPKLFRGRSGLGPNDLIIAASDSYDIVDDDARSNSSDEDRLAQKEVVATICQILQNEDIAQGKVEICLNLGSSWIATPLPKGGYEFIGTACDGSKTIARWVSRKADRRKSTGSLADEKRFTFSLINAGTRKHPVIASLTSKAIEIHRNYPSHHVPITAITPTSPMLSPQLEDGYFDEDLDTPTMIQVDELLRTFITISGIWVAFREGWSENFSYNDATTMSTIAPKCSTSASKTKINTESKKNRTASKATESKPLSPAPGATFGLSGCSVSAPSNIQSLGNKKRVASTGEAFLNRLNSRRSQVTDPKGKANVATAMSASSADTDRQTCSDMSSPRFSRASTATSSQITQHSIEHGRPRRSTEPSRPSLLPTDIPTASQQYSTLPRSTVITSKKKTENNLAPPIAPPKGKRWRRFSNMMTSTFNHKKHEVY